MSAQVVALRDTTPQDRVLQAYQDAYRALCVLNVMYDVEPEAFSMILKDEEGNSFTCHTASAVLVSEARDLMNTMERDYRAKINKLFER